MSRCRLESKLLQSSTYANTLLLTYLVRTTEQGQISHKRSSVSQKAQVRGCTAKESALRFESALGCTLQYLGTVKDVKSTTKDNTFDEKSSKRFFWFQSTMRTANHKTRSRTSESLRRTECVKKLAN